MYVDPNVFSSLQDDPAPLAVAGAGIGINEPKYYTGVGLGIQQYKPAKPFIIVDGVVYINASMIKENTL